MKISPLDIRKQNFKRALRGVDPEEVRMFLEVVASEYEKVLQDNAMMAEKLRYQDQRLDEYRDLERSMRNSLVTADRIANESREASEREAGRIIQDAHTRAERILEDSRERLQKLVQDVESLRSKKDIYVRRFRTMLEAQLSVLNEQGQQFDEIHGLENSAHSLLETSHTHLDGDAHANTSASQGSTEPSSNGSSAHSEGGAATRPFRMSVVPPPSSQSSSVRGVPESRDVGDLAPESVASFEIDAHETATTFPSPGAYGASSDEESEEESEETEPRAHAGDGGSSGDLFSQRPADASAEAPRANSGPSGDEEIRGEAVESSYSKADVRGVGRFFRRTHANLSLEDHGSVEPDHQEEDEATSHEQAERDGGGDDSSAEFFKMQQRSEGFFEIDAAERSRKA